MDRIKSRPYPPHNAHRVTRALNPATLSPVRRLRLSSSIGCLPPHRRTADATAVSSSAEFLSLRLPVAAAFSTPSAK
ncbi:unnamed protein product [Musa hybrid cultivar]